MVLKLFSFVFLRKKRWELLLFFFGVWGLNFSKEMFGLVLGSFVVFWWWL